MKTRMKRIWATRTVTVGVISMMAFGVLYPLGAARAYAQQITLPRIAVIDFQNKSGVGGQSIARAATDAIASEFQKTGKYEVLARGEVEQQLKDLELAPPLDRIGFLRLGRALQTESLIAGEVNAITFVGSPKQAQVTLSVRVIDIASGEPVNGAVATGRSNPRPGYAGDDDTLIQEAIRNPDLHRFVKLAMSDDKPLEQDLYFYHHGDTILNTRSSVLKNAKGQRIGTLLVLNDVTRLRTLENMRKDFAANVSHEIKTPLTAIKGFAETLRNGAIHNPEEAVKFVGIIENHANRLIAIIEDLMSLSRIEQKSVNKEIMLTREPICPLLASAVHICREKAEEKHIVVEVVCPEELSANINLPLLEQAFVNLLDNAVKYSNLSGRVRIGAVCSDTGIAISFQDTGIGIAKEHLPRLFERFYRVDKSRSRKQGGTGLGLAIAKQFVEAHGGTIRLETSSEGTKFIIFLPDK